MYAIQHEQHEMGTWYWRVSYSRHGKRCSRCFYEPMYGGSAKALKAAKAWRDEQLSKEKVVTLVDFCQMKRTNNRSGVPGVHFHVSERQPMGFWQAKITVAGGKSRNRSFSVRAYGRRRAYKMAVAAREEMLAQVEDRPYLYDSTALRLAREANGKRSAV